MLAHLNYLHIAVAALVYFIIGSLWFGLLFGKTWMKLVNITPTEEDKKNMPILFAMTFVYNLVITFSTACVIYFVQPTSILAAVKVGALLGIGLSATPIAMNYMYTKRPFMLTLLDGGYHVVSIIVVSIILTLWH